LALPALYPFRAGCAVVGVHFLPVVVRREFLRMPEVTLVPQGAHSLGLPLRTYLMRTVGGHVVVALATAARLGVLERTGATHPTGTRMAVDPSRAEGAWALARVVGLGLAVAADRMAKATLAGVLQGALPVLLPHRADERGRAMRRVVSNLFAVQAALWVAERARVAQGTRARCSPLWADLPSRALVCLV
jgi:hypothetical protein